MSSRTQATRPAALIVEIRRFIAGAIFFNQRVAERFHLNLTDTQCLNILELTGPATPSQLAAHTGLTSGGVTVVLDRLQKAGFIKREPNPRDRRSILIRTVPSGMERIHPMYNEIHRGMEALMGNFSGKELEVVVKFFEQAHRMRSERSL